jgi:hypothetical protein
MPFTEAAPPADRAKNGLRGTRYRGIIKGASLLISIDQTIENNFFKLASLF